MEAKFAVLKYAESYDSLFTGKIYAKSKLLRDRRIRKRLPYSASEINILGVDGLSVTLPITQEDARSDKRLKNDVFEGVLNILRESGIKAVKAAGEYEYDNIIPAASGFYVLPFILPVFLRKFSKLAGKDLKEIEILITDGIPDLTLDILLIIAAEINRITVLTEDTEFFQNVANGFYRDSGLNINVTDNRNDYGVKCADVILNASDSPDNNINRYRNGAVYLDMAGKRASELSSIRPDIIVTDGAELKTGGRYANTLTLETVLLSSNNSFSRYVFGKYSNNDFYGVLDYIDSLDFGITALLLEGKPVKISN